MRILALAFAACTFLAPLAFASETPAKRFADGLALEKRGDEKGAFVAFLEAAESGHPPAQRRLGEIFDQGNTAVERDYAESIRWYQRARDNGEPIPPQKSRLLGFPVGN